MEKTQTSKRRCLLVALACCFALVAAFALAGCSGGSSSGGASSGGSSPEPADTRTDFVWFKADVPEGYTVKPSGYVTTLEFINDEDDDKLIQVCSTKTDSSDKKIANRLGAGSYTAGEDLTINGRTYKVLNFTWNKTPSVMLYSDLGGEENKSVEICAFMLTPGDPALATLLENLEFSENIDEAYDQAKTTKLDDIEVK